MYRTGVACRRTDGIRPQATTERRERWRRRVPDADAVADQGVDTAGWLLAVIVVGEKEGEMQFNVLFNHML